MMSPVGDDRDRTSCLQAGDDVERTRIETLGERIVQEKQCDVEQAGIVGMLEAVALQHAEIAGEDRR